MARVPYKDSRFSVYWEHKISILPRKCWETEKWIRPFTLAWTRTEEHKYLLFRSKPRWYSDEYIIWAKLKGEL